MTFLDFFLSALRMFMFILGDKDEYYWVLLLLTTTAECWGGEAGCCVSHNYVNKKSRYYLLLYICISAFSMRKTSASAGWCSWYYQHQEHSLLLFSPYFLPPAKAQQQGTVGTPTRTNNMLFYLDNKNGSLLHSSLSLSGLIWRRLLLLDHCNRTDYYY